MSLAEFVSAGGGNWQFQEDPTGGGAGGWRSTLADSSSGVDQQLFDSVVGSPNGSSTPLAAVGGQQSRRRTTAAAELESARAELELCRVGPAGDEAGQSGDREDPCRTGHGRAGEGAGPVRSGAGWGGGTINNTFFKSCLALLQSFVFL
jgi:hypothetical protein